MSAAVGNRNEMLHDVLFRATGLRATWTNDARANPFGWLRLERPEQLKDVARHLAEHTATRLCTITAYAEERDDTEKRRSIAYHFALGDTLLTVTIPLYDAETLAKLPVPSITPWFRNADWNEREFREMYNIDIPDHPNPRRLFLDERLDAGIMTKLIPFSAMANGAASNTLWEQVMGARGLPVAKPAEVPAAEAPVDAPEATAAAREQAVKLAAAKKTGEHHEPSFTPVSATARMDGKLAGPTLASIAAPAPETDTPSADGR